MLSFPREEIAGIRWGLRRFQGAEPIRNRQLMLALSAAASK
jgi:hypothetical protein